MKMMNGWTICAGSSKDFVRCCGKVGPIVKYTYRAARAGLIKMSYTSYMYI